MSTPSLAERPSWVRPLWIAQKLPAGSFWNVTRKPTSTRPCVPIGEPTGGGPESAPGDIIGGGEKTGGGATPPWAIGGRPGIIGGGAAIPPFDDGIIGGGAPNPTA